MKAFTLIEVIVVSLIVGIIGLGVIQVMANTNKVTYESTRKVMLNSNITRLMGDIGRDIHNGALLSSDGQNLTITDRDKLVTKWTVLNNKITRLNHDGNLKEFLFIGAKEISINNSSTAFKTGLTGVYHKAEISLSISWIETSGILTLPTITNTYYCRTNPQGVIW